MSISLQTIKILNWEFQKLSLCLSTKLYLRLSLLNNMRKQWVNVIKTYQSAPISLSVTLQGWKVLLVTNTLAYWANS
jgi:hypothetical protein